MQGKFAPLLKGALSIAMTLQRRIAAAKAH
jgi:hypothetical protein